MKQKKPFLANASATYGVPLQYQSLTQLIIYEVNTCNFLFFFYLYLMKFQICNLFLKNLVCVWVVVQNPDRNVIQEIATQHKSLKTFQPPIT